ncbi:uncharacterized protein LOC141588142 [Silene latifolia]|uniref:uncharacterized protein LOC141588142 n=1 Tax=Silene latifolia TaxID=37657 RepID=UPI003D789B23
MLVALRFPDNFRLLVMACLSSPSYTLNLNGAHFGYFKGRRGLRQGDPISPLLFCLCMEYLTRIMNFATTQWYFSKGDVQSIMLILRAIATFSAASGLKVNPSKSEVVFSGVADELKYDITQVSGFQEEKIVAKILSIGARKLSYAGRLVLINSVLNTLHNYWASIFLIPKGVIKRIEAICRNFLWSGESDYGRTPSVSWYGICCSKKEGGLGIKNAGVWNTASVGKLVNWLHTKADRLWVLWIDHVYLKGAQWDTYVPSPDSNWNLRNICRVKRLMEGGFQNSSWIATLGGYSVGAGYQWRKALNTRAKLYQLGFCMSNRCVLCEVMEETHEHLFGDCVYSSQVLDGMEQWLCLRISGPMNHYSKFQRKICRMAGTSTSQTSASGSSSKDAAAL